MPGQDQDADGDYDYFDQQHEVLDQNPFLEGVSGLDGTSRRTELYQENTQHEFWEDVFELFDGNPNNNSFGDGGNGSGNETPMPYGGQSSLPGYYPGGGVPVLLNGIDTTSIGLDDGIFGI